MTDQHDGTGTGTSDLDARRGATALGPAEHHLRRGAVLEALKVATAILWRLLVVAVAVVGFLYLLAELWVVVLPLLLALLLASILWPLNRLLRKALPPAVAAAAAVVGLLGVGAAVIWTAAALSVDGVRDLSAQAVDNLRTLGEFAEGLPFGLPDIDELLTSGLNWLQDNVGNILSQVSSGLGTIGSVSVTALLALVLTFFCLKDGDRFSAWMMRWTTGTVFVHVAEVSSRAWRTLSAYISAQAAVAFVDALFIGTGLWLLGVPLALPLAVLIFFAGFLPVIGAVATGILATLVALLAEGWVTALIVLGIVLLVQQLESNVLQPILVGKSLKLHPAVVLTGVTAGGTLFGIVGAFLATPIIAVVMVTFQYAREQLMEAAATPSDSSTDSADNADSTDDPAGASHRSSGPTGRSRPTD